MATYSMQLRTLIEQSTQQYNGLSEREKIEYGREKLFDFDYPIFDEDYRKVFETHFIRHFYMREIGFESDGLFKFNLESWLLIHMPYYNKLFESELIEFDPLENSRVNVNSQKTKDESQKENNNTASNTLSSGESNVTDSSTSTSTTNDDNFERQIDSDTPDSRLTLTANDGEGVIEYASKITEETENNSSTTNANADSQQDSTVSSKEDSKVNEDKNKEIDSIEDYVSNRAGKIGVQTYSKMLTEYRQTFLRIEKQIFDEMNQLFMLVY